MRKDREQMTRYRWRHQEIAICETGMSVGRGSELDLAGAGVGRGALVADDWAKE
jgi:hypothetical protein